MERCWVSKRWHSGGAAGEETSWEMMTYESNMSLQRLSESKGSCCMLLPKPTRFILQQSCGARSRWLAFLVVAGCTRCASFLGAAF